MVSAKELEARVERAYAATARNELVDLLGDLPGAHLRRREDARAQWRALVGPAEGALDLHGKAPPEVWQALAALDG